MADAAPVLIWIADHTKGRHWFNKVWLDFTGRSADQEAGFGWTQNVHEDDLARCLQSYAEGFDTRQPFRVGVPGPLRGRRRRAGSSNRRHPLFEGPGNSFSGYIGSCVDITESKQLQADREETLERRARRARGGRARRPAQGRVPRHAVARAAHAAERHPRLGADAAPASARQRRRARAASRSSSATRASQTQIIDDLLDMSRIISGKVRLDVQRDRPRRGHRRRASTPSSRRSRRRSCACTSTLDARAGPVCAAIPAGCSRCSGTC